MTLYCLSDDCEEFLVAAYNRSDVFVIVEGVYGPDTADELAVSRLYEYPPTFVFPSGETAADLVALGRGMAGRTGLVDTATRRYPKPPAAPLTIQGCHTATRSQTSEG